MKTKPKEIRKILWTLKPIFFGLCLFAAAGGSGWYLRNDSSFFIVEKTPFFIEVPEGHLSVASQLKPTLVRVLRGIQKQNIWRTDLRQLKSEILKNEWIREVRLQRRFPNEISVDVRLEDVVFNYLGPKNWVSIGSNGQKMVAASVGSLPDRPILKYQDIFDNPEKLQKILQLFRQVPNRGALSHENIGEVRLQKTEGLTLFLLKEKVRVHLGHDKISTKGLQVLRVTDYLKSQKQKARVIDASFNKKVLVRLRKRS